VHKALRDEYEREERNASNGNVKMLAIQEDQDGDIWCNAH
jgi:hypothetical protein